MGILPMSVHPAFRGTSAEMPRGRFVRSEPRAIIVPSEHIVTGAGQTGKRNPARSPQGIAGHLCPWKRSPSSSRCLSDIFSFL